MSCHFSALLKDRKGFELNAPIPHRPVIRRYALVYYHVSLIWETGMLSQSFISIGREKFSSRGTLSVVGHFLYIGPAMSCHTWS